nr:immunoglobulin light chain junction region [Macaca mulatta]
CQQGFSYPVTF